MAGSASSPRWWRWRSCSGSGRRLPFHLEVIGFAEEEGVRFATSYIGSSAVAGRFDMRWLARRDAAGFAMADVIREAGLDPEAIPSLARRREDLLGYLELHIEQGPALLTENLPLGIVTAIAGACALSRQRSTVRQDMPAQCRSRCGMMRPSPPPN